MSATVGWQPIQPARPTERHYQLAEVYLEDPTTANMTALQRGWRHCPDDPSAAADSCRAMLENRVVRRPGARANGTGQESHRSFRVEDDLWFAARDAAHAEGVTLASVLRDALAEYVAKRQ